MLQNQTFQLTNFGCQTSLVSEQALEATHLLLLLPQPRRTVGLPLPPSPPRWPHFAYRTNVLGQLRGGRCNSRGVLPCVPREDHVCGAAQSFGHFYFRRVSRLGESDLSRGASLCHAFDLYLLIFNIF